jgi:hypothetical protein
MRKLLLLGLMMWGAASAATYTEAQRLMIWRASDAAQVKAMKAADLAYPISCIPAGQPEPTKATFDGNGEMNNALNEKYKAAILKKYKLSEKAFLDIAVEGYNKHWPQIVYSPPGC